MTQAVLANGTQIGFDALADSPWQFDDIEEVLSLGEISYNKETIDVTNLDSTSREFIAGLADGASLQMEMNWIASVAQQALRTAASAGTQLRFLVVWPDSPQTKVSFTASVEQFGIGAESGAQIKASATIKISGALDWATTASIA